MDSGDAFASQDKNVERKYLRLPNSKDDHALGSNLI